MNICKTFLQLTEINTKDVKKRVYYGLLNNI